jgi:anti-sigma factor RsiW
MRCHKVRKWTSLRIDGELDANRCTAVDRHLSTCDACRAFADALPQLSHALDRVEAPQARWGFTDRVMARLPDEQPEGMRLPGWLEFLRPAPVGLAAVAFGLGVAVTVSLNGTNGDLSANGEQQDPVVQEVAGDYADVFAEASIQQDLWTLFSEAEG